MSSINYNFSKSDNVEFVKTLNQRVNAFFTANNISKTADSKMYTKTLVTFGFYVAIYLTILFSGVTNLFLVFTLWAMLGIGQALVGMCVMHDKVHGSYTRSKLTNLLLEIPIISIGVESIIWNIEHNFMHHNYTNVEGLDQDIHPRVIFRFSKNQPKKWFHRFQHIYATFFYGLLIIEWMSVKDYIKVLKYRKMNFFKTNARALQVALIITIKKSIFYLIFLGIPLWILPFSSFQIIGMFLTMLVVAGIVMTIVFQTAHVVPNADFLEQDNAGENESWHMHQLRTTSNFAIGNKLVTYLTGGLNHQIEHHLFPGVCHTHYPELAKIVKSTADEYEMPYHSYASLGEAISKHYALLKSLGK